MGPEDEFPPRRKKNQKSKKEKKTLEKN